MLRPLLLVLSIAPPEPPATGEAPTGAVEPPPPAVVVEPPVRPRRILRCLPGAEPCYRTTSARLLLATSGAIAAGAAVAVTFVVGDRWNAGDPAVPLIGGGLIAIGGAAIGGLAALLRGDGAAIPDRITPATIGLGVTMGGTSVADERAPWAMSASIAPTFAFPRDLGRLRVLARVSGDLGERVEVDPASDPNGDSTRFSPASRSPLRVRAELGLDLAFRVPYPIGARSPWLGQFELRYKPLVFVAHERLYLYDADNERISQRIALAPLNLGFRWHLSPRQRFTVYLGPRWDWIGYGEPGSVAIGGRRGTPVEAPMYGESWFDLDVPLHEAGRSRRATAVGQLTLGYVHSRFGVEGINLGSVVGFLGHVVAQFAVRVRPRDSRVAYQLEIGARAGQAISPYVRVGIVLPDIGANR